VPMSTISFVIRTAIQRKVRELKDWGWFDNKVGEIKGGA
jgi:hypothetical protein